MPKQVFTILLLILTVTCSAQTLAKRTVTLMGSRWDISIVADDSAASEKYIDTVIAEVSRIELLLSDWKAESQVSVINRQAGISPVKVDREVFDLTKRAIEFSNITSGAFDISFAAMDRIWKFDGSMTEMPSAEAIKMSVRNVGFKNIVLDSAACTVFLKKKGMKIGFGALGEGYAADICRDMMVRKGVKAGIINGSGDMRTWGKHPDGSNWKIAITDPFRPGKFVAVVPLQDEAVVTSGSYEKFVLLNGKRYSHIINPATGYPASGLTSVTVFGPSAEFANGLSTSMMVLGKEAGLKLLAQYPAYKCLIITDHGKIYTSRNISKRTVRSWKKSR